MTNKNNAEGQIAARQDNEKKLAHMVAIGDAVSRGEQLQDSQESNTVSDTVQPVGSQQPRKRGRPRKNKTVAHEDPADDAPFEAHHFLSDSKQNYINVGEFAAENQEDLAVQVSNNGVVWLVIATEHVCHPGVYSLP